jgi:hypothetical protein
MSPSSHLQELTIVYSPWKKLVALLGLALILFLAWLGLQSDFFIFEVTLVLLVSYTSWNIIDILSTQSICFYADKIVKTGYLGQTTIPACSLVTTVHYQEQITRFFHASDKNIRESIKVYGWFLSPELKLWLENYQHNVYRTDNFVNTTNSKNTKASLEFKRAVSSFRLMAMLTAIYLLIYVFNATYLHGHYQVFKGYAPNLASVPLRLLFIGIALLCYRLLQRLAASLPPEPCTYTVKIKHGRNKAFDSALVANGVIWLGFPLFLLCGNKLDFYLMLLIGVGYYYDFYPRLSGVERLLQTSAPITQSVQTNIPRRSLQVSLVLLGGLSLVGYAGSQADFRIRQNNCKDNNSNAAECQSSSGGGSGSGYRSIGSSDNHSSIRRGGFGFFGGSHSSFGG